MAYLKTVHSVIAVIMLCLVITTGSLSAQPPGETAGDSAAKDQKQRSQDRTQMDSEQMQQRMIQRYQELLGMSDEEWAVIGPYVLKVYTLSSSTQSRGTGRTMTWGRGNTTQGTQDQSRGRGTTTQDGNLQALQTLLQDEGATSDEIKAKLSAYRKAREASALELATARKELRELLTLRQEALLVVMGILE